MVRVGSEDLLRPTGDFTLDVLLDRIELHVRKADRACSLWAHYKAEIPGAALMTAVHHWSDAALTTEQAKVWKAVDAAIGSYTGGVMTLSGPRGIAKSAGAARWAMNRPGEIRWLRAPEAGRISLHDSGKWQAIHDALVASKHRVVIDDLGSFNTTHSVAINRLGDLVCSLHEAGTEVCITTNFGRTALEQVYDQAEGGQGRLVDRITGHGATWVDLWDIAEGVPSFREHAPEQAPSPAAASAIELLKAVYTARQSGDVGPVLRMLGIDEARFMADVEAQARNRARVMALCNPMLDRMRMEDEAEDD